MLRYVCGIYERRICNSYFDFLPGFLLIILCGPNVVTVSWTVMFQSGVQKEQCNISKITILISGYAIGRAKSVEVL